MHLSNAICQPQNIGHRSYPVPSTMALEREHCYFKTGAHNLITINLIKGSYTKMEFEYEQCRKFFAGPAARDYETQNALHIIVQLLLA